MNPLNFEWNRAKATINKQKHGISFEEAKSVFYDDFALLIADPVHSESEDRFIILGMSTSLHILIVCHCYRNNSTIRIISARKATKNEINQYKEGRGE